MRVTGEFIIHVLKYIPQATNYASTLLFLVRCKLLVDIIRYQWIRCISENDIRIAISHPVEHCDLLPRTRICFLFFKLSQANFQYLLCLYLNLFQDITNGHRGKGCGIYMGHLQHNIDRAVEDVWGRCCSERPLAGTGRVCKFHRWPVGTCRTISGITYIDKVCLLLPRKHRSVLHHEAGSLSSRSTLASSLPRILDVEVWIHILLTQSNLLHLCLHMLN